MTKNNKGFLQVGLAVLVASVLVAGFLIQKVKFDVPEAVDVACDDPNGYYGCGIFLCSPQEMNSHSTCNSGDSYAEKLDHVPSCFCGTIQIDKGSTSQTITGNCGCDNNDNKCSWSQLNCPPGTVIDLTQPGIVFDAPVTYCPNPGTAQRETGVCNHMGGGTPGTCGDWYNCPKPNNPGKMCRDCTPGEENVCTNRQIQNYGCKPIGTPTPSPTPVITPSPSPTPSRSPSPTPTCTPSHPPSPTPTRSPSPSPVCTPSPTPVPQCNSFCVSDSQCLTGSTCFWGRCRNPSCKTSNSCTCSSPTPSPSPRPSASPTSSPSPTATPIAQGKLKICKYNDLNNNGHIDDGEKTVVWNFIYKYQDSEHKVGSSWWSIFDHGCREVSVPANQWINVREEYKNEWTQTGVYQDGNWVGNSDYNYIAESNVLKNVTFLNHFERSSTPAPTASATPNWCNGTCGSNYNCQGGLFCYNGYCRNPNCSSDTSCGCGIIATPTPTAPPVVLGATAPPVLPKTGANTVEIILGFTGLIGAGVYLFKKFKLV